MSQCSSLIFAPTRAHVARASAVFDFLPSPFGDKKLWYKGLKVKVSPDLPSPVKAKKRTKLHPQNTRNQRITGEGEG